MSLNFGVISEEIIAELKTVIGKEFVLADEENKLHYGHDETEDLVYKPGVIVRPSSTSEVSAVMKLCFDRNIPITPRGAGTGLSGGALPVFGGVLLSMDRFNKIIFIDEENFQVTVEPGVITEVLQNTVKEKGLFYPPDPASKGSCFIGGNIAENSGGPKAVKYGVVKDYVLNLEMVLPNGEIIWTGANVLKNATGYNLTQLIVGSEGTLGIVTKIVLRLIPHPTNDVLMLAPFSSAEKACEAVNAIFRAGVSPSGLEFMERDAIEWAAKHIGETNLPVNENIEAHLLIEVDGNDMDALYRDAEKITEVLQQFNCGEILFADTAQQKSDLWKLRRSVAEAVKMNSVYKEEDTVVPRAKLPQLLKGVKTISKNFGFKSVCYGHAGDGNLHVNIIKGNLTDDEWNNNITEGIREIFKLVIELGGTLSGEHGIGFVQKPYMEIAFNKTQLQLMKDIKKVFDPKGIMNPGKIFAD